VRRNDRLLICIVNLPDSVTQGGAYDAGGASPVGEQGHVICCSGRRLFLLKAAFAAYCTIYTTLLAIAGPGIVYVNRKLK